MNPSHPFVKYGLAVVLTENNFELETVESDELLVKTT
jgi:hypothetical protein